MANIRRGFAGAWACAASGAIALSNGNDRLTPTPRSRLRREMEVRFDPEDFKRLDYYHYSTMDPYLDLHAEHNFGGFILNKIPVIRKLKLSEVAGAGYLHTSQLKNYLEVSVGIEKLNLFRVDFVTSFADGKKASAGFIFGLKGIF